jgi:hypothetical protein
MDAGAHMRHDAAVIERHRPNVTAALNEAEDDMLRLLAAGTALRLAGICQRCFVSFDGFSNATKLANGPRRHCKTNAVPKVPSGFHAAAEHALKLAGADALLAGAQQMDRLKPVAQRQMGVLENRALADSEFLAASVALAKADLLDAFGMLFAGLGANAGQTPDFLAGYTAMRAHGTVRPKLSLDVGESGLFTVKTGVGKYRLCHDLAPIAKVWQI